MTSLDEELNNVTKRKRIADVHTPSQSITLNIGGTTFRVDPLNFGSHPNTLLGRMFSPDNKTLLHRDSEYFFDRNPEIFKYLMDFYRTGHFPSLLLNPALFDRDVLNHELTAWGFNLPCNRMLDMINATKDEGVLEVQRFVSGLLESKEFIDDLQRNRRCEVYFQNLTKEYFQFNTYFDKSTKMWVPFKEDMSVQEKVSKWEILRSAPVILHDIYIEQRCQDTDPDDIQDTLYTVANYVSEMTVAMNIAKERSVHCVFELTQLMYALHIVEDATVLRLKMLKSEMVRLLRNQGFTGKWITKFKMCSNSQLQTKLPHTAHLIYPFTCESDSTRMEESPSMLLPWCEDCSSGKKHKPKHVPVTWLEISL